VALFAAYISGDVKGIAEGHQKLPVDETFRPFEVSTHCSDFDAKSLRVLQSTSPVTQRNLVALFAAGIVPLRKEVSIFKKPAPWPR
jgi:DNA repair/transcription protein MET18/MMS19